MIESHLKGILTFLGLVATNAAADWMAHGAPIPNNWGDGLRWIGTIVAGTLLVSRTPNFYSIPALQQKLSDAQDRAAGRHSKPE